MILQDLINKFSWKEIEPIFLDICDGRYIELEFKKMKKDIPHYSKAYTDCKNIKPVSSKAVIHASPLIVDGTMVEDMEVFYTNGKKNKNNKNIKDYFKNVSKKNQKEFLDASTKYSVDFTSRNKVVGMSVDEKDVKNLTEEKFVAYCFFFITMSGISSISQRKNTNAIKKMLKKATDDIDSGKVKLFSMEEVMSNVKNFKK